MTLPFLGPLFFILVASSHGHRNQIPALGMEAFERKGDVLIGGVFPLHFNTLSDAVEITFTEPPDPTHCLRFIQQHQHLPTSRGSSGTANRSHPSASNSSSLALWFYKYIQTMVFAIEEINQDPNLLPNITLGFQIFDSCESVSRALLGTMQFLTGRWKAVPNFRCRHHPRQAGIIGAACIAESWTIARLLDLYKYPQISYFATGPLTNDASQFLSFFSTLPNNKHQALGLARLVIHFAWTWVGLLAADTEYGSQGIELLREQILKKRACIAFSHRLPVSLDSDVTNIVKSIVGSQARVILTFCGREILPVLLLLCVEGVTGRVWVSSEAISYTSSFNNEKVTLMLNGSLSIATQRKQVPGLRDFLVGLHPAHSSGDVFIHGFWSKVFTCWWSRSPGKEGNSTTRPCTGKESLRNGTNSFVSLPGFSLGFNVYNAVYAIAHALHNMAPNKPRRQNVLETGVHVGTNGFNSWKLLQPLRKVHFQNKVDDEVFFDEHGDPPALFDILNTWCVSAKRRKIVKVGRLSSQDKELEINSSTIVWAGGGTEVPISVCTRSCLKGYRRVHQPHKSTCCFDCVLCMEGEISNHSDSSTCSRCAEDLWPDEERTQCVPKREQFLSFYEPLGAGLASTSVCGSLLPILILAVFVAHRETPLVRANSHELSYLLLLGLALSFLCCLLFLGRPTRSACLLRQVAFGMAFALCLSCLLAKTLIVVAAFRATNPNSHMKQWLGSRTPRAVVLSGCLPQFLLSTAWLAISPPSPERDMRSVPHAVTLLCHEGSSAAFWGMLAYLCLLAGLGLVGAFLARNLPDAFNEAWLICFSLFGCLSVWLAFVPVYLTSREQYAAATEVIAILGSSLALLSGMFLPKCYILLLRPELNTKSHLMRRGKESIWGRNG